MCRNAGFLKQSSPMMTMTMTMATRIITAAITIPLMASVEIPTTKDGR